jgi:GNAT superfamily N-acetyltransferase
MPVLVKEISPGNRKELKRFVNFAYRLYRNNPYWIPPMISGEMETLNPRKNPAYEHCDTKFLLAYKDGRIGGRVAAIINHRYNEQWNKKAVRFGWFESIDDREVTEKLLNEVEEWGRAQGMDRMEGPMGFTTFDHNGILVKGFDEMPTFAGVHTPPYYMEHLERLGFGKEIEYVEYELTVPEKIPDKAIKISELVAERYHLKLLKVKSSREMLPYAVQVFHVLNEAYKPLFGFTQLTEKQIDYFVKKYFSVVRPEYTTAVLDQQGQVVGFQISMPSLSRAFQKARGRLFPLGWIHLWRALKNPDRLDLLLTGVLPEYQSKGVNALFMVDLTSTAIANGIIHAESNSELEENFKVQSFWRHFEARQHRRSRIYSRPIK